MKSKKKKTTTKAAKRAAKPKRGAPRPVVAGPQAEFEILAFDPQSTNAQQRHAGARQSVFSLRLDVATLDALDERVRKAGPMAWPRVTRASIIKAALKDYGVK